MQSLKKALLLYWGVFGLDFATSVLFIALGYGFAESNQAQRALVSDPGVATLVPWLVNQGLWVTIGGVGIAAFVFSKPLAGEAHLVLLLALMSVIRLYGVASNLGFTVLATTGFPLVPAACYALLSIPLGLSLRREILTGLRLVPLKG